MMADDDDTFELPHGGRQDRRRLPVQKPPPTRTASTSRRCARPPKKTRTGAPIRARGSAVSLLPLRWLLS